MDISGVGCGAWLLVLLLLAIGGAAFLVVGTESLPLPLP
jgi:hypothetical protein